MRHQLTEADDGTTLAAQTGDEIDLCLRELPSGGYRWLLDGAPDEMLEKLEHRSDFPAGTVGARSETHFLFRVRASGRGLVRLRYARSWEADQPPLNSFEVAIEAN